MPAFSAASLIVLTPPDTRRSIAALTLFDIRR
jgi:hypothetical protein